MGRSSKAQIFKGYIFGEMSFELLEQATNSYIYQEFISPVN